MTGNIFTYGSLMFDEVWRQVVSGRYRSEPATLHHHQRHALTGLSYPGVVAAAGVQVAGRLYFDVSDPNVAFINVQHPSSGVDRTIQITAVPDVGSAWLMVLGLGLIGAVVRRHSGRATLSRPAAE